MFGGGFSVSPQFYLYYSTLVVPTSGLQQPLYYTGDVKHVSYASLGMLIAEEVVAAINQRGQP